MYSFERSLKHPSPNNCRLVSATFSGTSCVRNFFPFALVAFKYSNYIKYVGCLFFFIFLFFVILLITFTMCILSFNSVFNVVFWFTHFLFKKNIHIMYLKLSKKQNRIKSEKSRKNLDEIMWLNKFHLIGVKLTLVGSPFILATP